MRLYKLLAVTAIALSAISAPVWATPIISFDEGTGGSGANNAQNVGWQFDVISSLTVLGLGWFDEGANGLGHEHMVGIWAPDGTLLTSMLVLGGTAEALDGQYRMVAITPVVLAPGAGYIVGGLNFSNSGDRLAFDVTMAVDPRIGFVDATFSAITTTFLRPTDFSGAITGFFGPMFSADLINGGRIPEPGTLAIFGFGLLGLGLARRRRKTA